MNIAINGFGRIGRTFLRTVMLDPQARKKLSVVAINLGPSKPNNLDILFAHDSVMGTYPGNVSMTETELIIDDTAIRLVCTADAQQLPWKTMNIDWVVEASGHYVTGPTARQHITAGAHKVLITAPATDEDATIIPGVNDTTYDRQKHTVVSLGSCTTNCLAPVVKVLHTTFGITRGLMTTTHAYTNDQVLLDVAHKDPRRARAAGLNMIPTKTGASKVITKIFPDLDGKINGLAIRVPVPTVSLLDFTFTSDKTVTVESINTALQSASEGPLKSIMTYETKPLVSSDFKGNPASAIIDSLLTQATGNMGKVFAWYDNEFGYSCRLKDFLTSQ